MITKKVCMLGAFSVGKTSLVKRFVESIFSEKYLTTIGVKIDTKIVISGNKEVKIVLWDIQGEDEFRSLQLSYLRGSAGYLLIVDGTREATLSAALEIKKKVENAIGKVPFVMALNKSDIAEDWELDEKVINELKIQGWTIKRTSAKSGMNVEDIFLDLTNKMLEK